MKQKAASKIKNIMPKLSADMSSGTIADGIYIRKNDIFTKIQNEIKNRTVLNQAEGIFQNFHRDTFDKAAIDIYNSTVIADDTFNKIELMKLVSHPQLEVITNCKKDPKLIKPFKFYKPISAHMAMARIFSHDDYAFNKYFTWHQISMIFKMEDKNTGEIIEKINVFERREVDAADGYWRLAYLEN